jgi:hypothetical protein
MSGVSAGEKRSLSSVGLVDTGRTPMKRTE